MAGIAGISVFVKIAVADAGVDVDTPLRRACVLRAGIAGISVFEKIAVADAGVDVDTPLRRGRVLRTGFTRGSTVRHNPKRIRWARAG